MNNEQIKNDNILDNKTIILSENVLDNKTIILSEEDFYPPEDNRDYKSNVKDYRNGDNFAEYAEWFWETYEEELYDTEY